MVAVSIDLDHVRRSRRLLAILVDRFSVGHFMDGQLEGQLEGQLKRDQAGRVNPRACEDAIALACAWIERRTGREVAEDIAGMMRRDLKRILLSRIASGASCSR